MFRFLTGAARLTWWFVAWFVLFPLSVLVGLVVAIFFANLFEGLVPTRGLPILFLILGTLIVMWLRRGPRATQFRPW